ncbi:MAG: hypothetical protein LBJ26_05020 [Paenibacillus sp.]|nr:hypothetical protein [Paenibacillus sp.]
MIFADYLHRLLQKQENLSIAETIAHEQSFQQRRLGLPDAAIGQALQNDLLVFGGQDQGNLFVRRGQEWFESKYTRFNPAFMTGELPVYGAETQGLRSVSVERHHGLSEWELRLRYLLAAHFIRLAEEMLEHSIAYAKTREVFGQLLFKYQMVTDPMVVASSELDGNKLYLLARAEALEIEEDGFSRTKHLLELGFLFAQVAELADSIAPLLGAQGMTEGSPLLGSYRLIHQLAAVGGGE